MRLWPISREARPKQFIKVQQGKSMLILTLERISKSIPPERCFIITGKDLFELTRDEVKGFLPEENILLEPAKRNTAACIAYATMLMERKFKKGLLCFLPADSTINTLYDGKFMTALFHAFRAAEKSSELVVIGIPPTYPATGYGYIRFNPKACLDSREVFRVRGFYEKPDAAKAKSYMEAGEYLWNSGMVIGSIDALLNNLSIHLQHHYDTLNDALWLGKGSPDALEQAYEGLEDVSFDVGVLEKSQNLHVVRGYFQWEDIGSLDALSGTFPADSNQNRVIGEHCGINTHNTVIYSDEGLVATIDLDNLIIIRSGDAVLVCPREKAQKVRQIVEELKKKAYGQYQ